MSTGLPSTPEERAPFLPGIGDLEFSPAEIDQVRADAIGHKHTGNQTRERNAVLYRAVVALRSVAMSDVDIARTLGVARNTVRAICQHDDAVALVEHGKKGMSRKLLVSGFRVLQAALTAAHTVGPRDQAIIGGIALDHGRELDALAMGEGAGSGEAKGEAPDAVLAKVRAMLAADQVIEVGQTDEPSHAECSQHAGAKTLAEQCEGVDPTLDPIQSGLEPAPLSPSCPIAGPGGGGVETPDGPVKSMGEDSENLNDKRDVSPVETISPLDLSPVDPRKSVENPEPPEKGMA